MIRKIWSFILCVLIASIVYNVQGAENKPKATRNVEITADDEKLRDPAGYEAIKELHRLMDDDQSGSIDRFESTDFLQEDLKLTGNDKTRRERAFHHDDDSITVDDMWESWFESEERSWDEKTLVNWLVNIVKLPQYEKNFIEKKVTGVALPRMAIQNSSYLASVLGIKNFVHRQKLQLKALDLVLFGFHELPTSYVKDGAFIILTIICLVLGYLYTQSRIRNKQQVEVLNTRLNDILKMQSEFEGDKNQLAESEDHAELRRKLEEAQRRLEMVGPDAINFALQPLLRQTYELEVSCINEKRIECLKELNEAKEHVDKMRRGKLGIVNSLKLATGATTTSTSAIDAKVFELKQRMEKNRATMEDCHRRWLDIETMCGFQITGLFGTASSPVNGSIVSSMSSPKLSSLNGSRKPSPPSSIKPLSSHNSTSYSFPSANSTFSSDMSPPSTVNQSLLKNELSALTRIQQQQQRMSPHLSDDTNSLSSSKSSSSLTKRFGKFIGSKKKVKV